MWLGDTPRGSEGNTTEKYLRSEEMGGQTEQSYKASDTA